MAQYNAAKRSELNCFGGETNRSKKLENPQLSMNQHSQPTIPTTLLCCNYSVQLRHIEVLLKLESVSNQFLFAMRFGIMFSIYCLCVQMR